ncbi:MAG: NUDIX domain-containing protein [Spirochaetes bacterium]|nr:MAG: NUDIX domain-containing protein [Spirochaetota bacterium]
MKKPKLFCCYCGKEIARGEMDGKMRDYCPHCGSVFYENPLPVASTIVVNENREVLLVKRKKDPYRDMWCLPIGFAESGEEIHDAALRELEEEAGVRGEITRLIDVDTVENYFYGSLAIVTYEARITGGSVRPGDDASDAGFFPILDLPPLAWSSNEKAVKLYIEMNTDTWTMVDSFRHLFPDIDSPDGIKPRDDEHYAFLSNVLVKFIDRSIIPVTDGWAAEIARKLPALAAHLDVLYRLNLAALRGIQYWLTRGTDTLGIEEFIESGARLEELGIPLPEAITAMALSRKSLWMLLVKEKIFLTPIEIYTTLELNNRIIFFYDKINYFLALGYVKTKKP